MALRCDFCNEEFEDGLYECTQEVFEMTANEYICSECLDNNSEELEVFYDEESDTEKVKLANS